MNEEKFYFDDQNNLRYEENGLSKEVFSAKKIEAIKFIINHFYQKN